MCTWLLFFQQENGQLAERQANEHFERLFEVLQERKSEMLRSIEQSRNRRMQQLKAQVCLKSSYRSLGIEHPSHLLHFLLTTWYQYEATCIKTILLEPCCRWRSTRACWRTVVWWATRRRCWRRRTSPASCRRPNSCTSGRTGSILTTWNWSNAVVCGGDGKGRMWGNVDWNQPYVPCSLQTQIRSCAFNNRAA